MILANIDIDPSIFPQAYPLLWDLANFGNNRNTHKNKKPQTVILQRLGAGKPRSETTRFPGAYTSYERIEQTGNLFPRFVK